MLEVATVTPSSQAPHLVESEAGRLAALGGGRSVRSPKESLSKFPLDRPESPAILIHPGPLPEKTAHLFRVRSLLPQGHEGAETRRARDRESEAPPTRGGRAEEGSDGCSRFLGSNAKGGDAAHRETSRLAARLLGDVPLAGRRWTP